MLRITVTEAFGNLLASRQRSILALVGILIGAGAVIAMLNIGAMAQNETVKLFQQMGTDIVSIRGTESAGLNLADVQELAASRSILSAAAPLAVTSSNVVYQGNARTTPVLGVTEAFGKMARLRTGEGRLISDFDRFELYCVVGHRLALDLSTSGAPLRAGSVIRLGRYLFRVLSVLDPVATNPMMPGDANNSILVSIQNARRISAAATISTVLGRVPANSDPEVASAQLTDYFKSKPRNGQVEVQTAQQLIAGMANQMRLFQLLLGIIGAIALVLGGVGVMNIMLISVQERHREIGIRLAIGARRRNIQALFLSEAIILAVVGGALGIVLGIAGSYAFAQISDWEFVLSPAAAPLGAGVSIAVGIFFGFYPAVMASRLDPIVALRSE